MHEHHYVHLQGLAKSSTAQLALDPQPSVKCTNKFFGSIQVSSKVHIQYGPSQGKQQIVMFQCCQLEHHHICMLMFLEVDQFTTSSV